MTVSLLKSDDLSLNECRNLTLKMQHTILTMIDFFFVCVEIILTIQNMANIENMSIF